MTYKENDIARRALIIKYHLNFLDPIVWDDQTISSIQDAYEVPEED